MVKVPAKTTTSTTTITTTTTTTNTTTTISSYYHHHINLNNYHYYHLNLYYYYHYHQTIFTVKEALSNYFFIIVIYRCFSFIVEFFYSAQTEKRIKRQEEVTSSIKY